MSDTKCPICETELGFKAWEDGFGSQEICASCGVMFGYTDACGGSEENRNKLYTLWRKAWEANENKPLAQEQYQPLIKEACSSAPHQ